MCITCCYLRWKANRVPGATHRVLPSQSKPNNTLHLFRLLHQQDPVTSLRNW
ncbi:hypothetical protein HBI73_205740 [Parastagonospora nodorum]|nr:hypothetical protein HBH51_171100 [Parastagonospora nodorum]KAH4063989.1 hypothetical protein HBH50_180820 [Parastagonospora nodorum]KAH4087369.1 hypothetical protein HBH48_131130 [Parastagonospora nodorum]KAH4181886.1 hypothetical protein HBH42_228980 [Parastagonospora nodorum]KAH4800156.1 hypothetical protein HBH61_217090 [Parastagonospora nodorum]